MTFKKPACLLESKIAVCFQPFEDQFRYPQQDHGNSEVSKIFSIYLILHYSQHAFSQAGQATAQL